MSTDERTQLEQALLGCMILDPKQIDAVIAVLPSIYSFSGETNRAIYRAILDLKSQGIAVGVVELTEYMKKNHGTSTLDTADYLIELTSGVPSALAAPYYANELKTQTVAKPKFRPLDDGGPINPIDPRCNSNNEPITSGYLGLTKREYYAAHALSRPIPSSIPQRITQKLRALFGFPYKAPSVFAHKNVEAALEVADTMITYTGSMAYRVENKWCAIMLPVIDGKQNNPIGFGGTPDEARADLHFKRMAAINYPH
jgi:hypothetical protein